MYVSSWNLWQAQTAVHNSCQVRRQGPCGLQFFNEVIREFKKILINAHVNINEVRGNGRNERIRLRSSNYWAMESMFPSYRVTLYTLLLHVGDWRLRLLIWLQLRNRMKFIRLMIYLMLIPQQRLVRSLPKKKSEVSLESCQKLHVGLKLVSAPFWLLLLKSCYGLGVLSCRRGFASSRAS